jgi:hypothetical protein
LAYEKHQSAYGLCGVFLRHIFLRPETATQFLYRAQKNVACSRNVMRNTPEIFLKMYLFNNPVGYCGLKSVASPAISRPGATLWGCEIAFFSGSCLTTLRLLQNFSFATASS